MRVAIAALALFALSAPVAGQAHDMSQMGHDATHAAKGGKLPAGWELRLDNAKAKKTDVAVHKVGTSVHVMTGPAAIVWRPADRAAGNFAVDATFEQEHKPDHPEAYGVIFGGANLDKPNQSYLYFLIRHDGRFLLKHRAGDEVHTLLDWTESPAVAKPDAKGSSTNRLTVDAGADMVRFLVNGKQVAEFERSKMAPNGLVGLRINHNLEVHVNEFKIVKK